MLIVFIFLPVPTGETTRVHGFPVHVANLYLGTGRQEHVEHRMCQLAPFDVGCEAGLCGMCLFAVFCTILDTVL